jgi:DNA-binding PadR family transcriptional regulator
MNASHLPHNLERTALQKMSATQGLPLAQLHPAGIQTIARMVAKGWIERQLDARAGARYCITPAGEAALKAKIPAGQAKPR